LRANVVVVLSPALDREPGVRQAREPVAILRAAALVALTPLASRIIFT
jgi:hypothetical protein